MRRPDYSGWRIEPTREALHALHEASQGLALRFDLRPVQLGLANDPWLVVVACQLLNQTSIAQARSAVAEFAARYRVPARLAVEGPEALLPLLTPLGLWRRRSERLHLLSMAWYSRKWRHAHELPGVGPYALDAVRMLCFEDFSGPEPQDGVMAEYWRARVGPPPPAASR